ncbi:MAG: arginine deiminase family protein [Actinomycetota bacterium]
MLTADPASWHYGKTLDPVALAAQFEHFAALVAEAGAEILWLPDDDDDLADSVFTYDPSFVVGDGAVILRPGKELRRGEAELHRRFYQGRIPILGAIEAPGVFEGGDCFWLDAETLAVGRGFRTNQAGIEQFRAIVAAVGITVEVFDLPYLNGPAACLHLLSVVSPLDDDLALVHAPLMPTALYQRMEELGYHLLHAPPEEFEASMGLNLNVLAVAPRRLLTVAGFDGTVDVLRSAGCHVTTFPGDELCLPCEGGPTCLTRPLLRA